MVRRTVALALACFALTGCGHTARAPTPTVSAAEWKAVIRDWYDGSIDHRHSCAAVREALTHVPQGLNYSAVYPDLGAYEQKVCGGRSSSLPPTATAACELPSCVLLRFYGAPYTVAQITRAFRSAGVALERLSLPGSGFVALRPANPRKDGVLGVLVFRSTHGARVWARLNRHGRFIAQMLRRRNIVVREEMLTRAQSARLKRALAALTA